MAFTPSPRSCRGITTDRSGGLAVPRLGDGRRPAAMDRGTRFGGKSWLIVHRCGDVVLKRVPSESKAIAAAPSAPTSSTVEHRTARLRKSACTGMRKGLDEAPPSALKVSGAWPASCSIAEKTSATCRAIASNFARAGWAGVVPWVMPGIVPVAESSQCDAPRPARVARKPRLPHRLRSGQDRTGRPARTDPEARPCRRLLAPRR